MHISEWPMYVASKNCRSASSLNEKDAMCNQNDDQLFSSLPLATATAAASRPPPQNQPQLFDRQQQQQDLVNNEAAQQARPPLHEGPRQTATTPPAQPQPQNDVEGSMNEPQSISDAHIEARIANIQARTRQLKRFMWFSLLVLALVVLEILVKLLWQSH